MIYEIVTKLEIQMLRIFLTWANDQRYCRLTLSCLYPKRRLFSFLPLSYISSFCKARLPVSEREITEKALFVFVVSRQNESGSSNVKTLVPHATSSKNKYKTNKHRSSHTCVHRFIFLHLKSADK